MAVINHAEDVVCIRVYATGIPGITPVLALAQGDPGMITIVIGTIFIVANGYLSGVIRIRTVPRDGCAFTLSYRYVARRISHLQRWSLIWSFDIERTDSCNIVIFIITLGNIIQIVSLKYEIACTYVAGRESICGRLG